jgi:hypothetical protein
LKLLYNNAYVENDHANESSGIKHNHSKIENDFFDDTKYIKEKIIRVKRIIFGKNERWKIFEDNKVIFIVEGLKISKLEKEFLRTIDGCQFLIFQGKNGIKSLHGLRKELRRVLI